MCLNEFSNTKFQYSVLILPYASAKFRCHNCQCVGTDTEQQKKVANTWLVKGGCPCSQREIGLLLHLDTHDTLPECDTMSQCHNSSIELRSLQSMFTVLPNDSQSNSGSLEILHFKKMSVLCNRMEDTLLLGFSEAFVQGKVYMQKQWLSSV